MTNTDTTKAPYRVRLVRVILSPVFVRKYKRDAKALSLPLTTLEEGLAVQAAMIARGLRVDTSAAGHSERVYFADSRNLAETLGAAYATSEERVYIGELRGKVYREV
jgi:hypothetical protein